MNIIRDEELSGLGMIPLLVDWHVRRCNVKGCTEKPTTILAGLGKDVPPAGMCEKHYQEGKAKADRGEDTTFEFVWDDFDAFKAAPVSEADAKSSFADEYVDTWTCDGMED